MQVTLTFEEMAVDHGWLAQDIINRACDTVMELCFPEFEETDVINLMGCYVDFSNETCVIGVSMPLVSEF